MSGCRLDTGTKPFYRSALSIVGFRHRGYVLQPSPWLMPRDGYIGKAPVWLSPLLLVLLVGQRSRSALTYRAPSVLASPLPPVTGGDPLLPLCLFVNLCVHEEEAKSPLKMTVVFRFGPFLCDTESYDGC